MLLSKIAKADIFSKFDLKSGFWQIRIAPEDHYKTTFVVLGGQYQWTVMPLELKNAPSEFQKRMEDIFRQLPFVLVYIDDLLVFSKDVHEHEKHLEVFYNFVYNRGLVLSASPDKFVIAQTKIDYLGLQISQGKFQLQPHILQCSSKFLDKLPDIKSTQRFLGCLNHVR